MNQSFHLKTNGEQIPVNPKNNKDFSLEELQAYVNGSIEIVSLLDNMCLVVNEEGLIEQLPTNMKASALAGWLIVGDVLLCNRVLIK